MATESWLFRVFFPEEAFPVGQCQWLMHCPDLRAVSKSVGLDWRSLGEVCSRWLQQQEVKHSQFLPYRVEKREEFPFIYNQFRASFLQRYALRALQQQHQAVIAGSYPVALYVQKQHLPMNWSPGDIDAWIHSDIYGCMTTYNRILHSEGVQLCPPIAGADDYPNQNESASDSDIANLHEDHVDNDDENIPRVLQVREPMTPEGINALLPAVLPPDAFNHLPAGLRNEVTRSIQAYAANLLALGRPRARRDPKLLDFAREPVPPRCKIMVGCFQGLEPHPSPCGGAGVERTDYLLQFRFVLLLRGIGRGHEHDWNSFVFCSSDDDLRNGSMRLLPCSFSNLQGPVTTQIRRIKKYSLRGYRLMCPDTMVDDETMIEDTQ